ncbi:MAG: UDP-2,3-diacylglucosamine diphosphatase [Muribaculaceae bacterium]|nr:UDP-2,3-diacylglucosamine diphosphatase [Muribaculaceae bacterium]
MRHLTYFISDLHLGAGYIADRRAHERTICSWLESIAADAKELYLLGDILDYWYEYHDVVPRGFVRFFGALARLADSGVKITWLTGNHDIWIFDYLPSEIGMEVVDGTAIRIIDGKRFLLEHGDGVGELRRSYRFMHRMFRNRTCQRLFSAIHPRWTVGFAHRWSAHSRLTGTADTTEGIADNDPLVRFARKTLDEGNHIDYFVFGHRHKIVDMPIGTDSRLILLGDGFKLFSYGVFDGTNFSIKFIKNESASGV